MELEKHSQPDYPTVRVGPVAFGLTPKFRVAISIAGIAALWWTGGQWFLSQFTQSRGIVDLAYSRVMLGGLWVVGALMCFIIARQLWRKRIAVLVSVSVPLFVVIFLDSWAPKSPKASAATTPVQQKAAPCIPENVQFIPPKEHKLLRYDDTFLVPSHTLCPPNGMTDEARIACLCPNRLPYTLRAMDAPDDGNYETEVTISKVCNPLYKVRLFFRDVYYRGGSVFSASPYSGEMPGVTLVRGMSDNDRYSAALTSTAPEDTFKVSMVTSTGLRLLCVNQEN